MPVKTMKIEIDVPNDRKQAWREMAIEVQRMKNRLWQIWLCHHCRQGTADQVRAEYDAYNEWKKEKKGPKPKSTYKVLPPELTKSALPTSFYRILSAEFPGVSSQPRGLVTKAWTSLLSKRKAARGNLPGWVAILFGMESIPSFTHPQPIPFDRACSKLLESDGAVYLEMRVERDPENGKSTVDRFDLKIKRRKVARYRRNIRAILDGEYAWKGSTLSVKKGRWFVNLCYESPVMSHGVPLDANSVLELRADEASPWRVYLNGERSWRFGGAGDHVLTARHSIDRERRSRQQHNRYGGSNRKGHGGKHARAIWTKMNSYWRDFVKRYNNEITRKLINTAITERCGKIVYAQPMDSDRNNLFLYNAGRDEKSKATWDFFQVGTMLAAKCEEAGIEFEIIKSRPDERTELDARGPRLDGAAGGVRGVRQSVPAKHRQRAQKTTSGVR